jgi:hypothetical protein
MVKQEVWMNFKGELKENDVIMINNFARGVTKGEVIIALMQCPVVIYTHLKASIGNPLSMKD